MNKKYEFTGKTKVADGVMLKRIRAVKNFGGVKKGDAGGWIESESNLSHEGECWVSDEARVHDNACVSGNAWVTDRALVCGNAQVQGDCWISGNAWVFGNAWVYGAARVGGHAWVFGNARVYETAWVYGDAVVCNNDSVCREDEVYQSNRLTERLAARDSKDTRCCMDTSVKEQETPAAPPVTMDEVHELALKALNDKNYELASDLLHVLLKNS